MAAKVWANPAETERSNNFSRFAARGLARDGFYVFPVIRKNDVKQPAHKGWQQEATCDLDAVDKLFPPGNCFSVGLIPERSGHVVIDLDVKHGHHGIECFEALQIEHDGGAEPPAVITASGGRHLYFRGSIPRDRIGKLGDGIDVKHRGFVVAPGSVGYRLAPGSKPLREAPPLPDWLDALCRQGSEAEPRRAAPGVVLDDPARIAMAVGIAQRAAPGVEFQASDAATIALANRLLDWVDEGHTVDILIKEWMPRCEGNWDESYIALKVHNAAASRENEIGCAEFADPAGWFVGEEEEINKPRMIDVAPLVIGGDYEVVNGAPGQRVPEVDRAIEGVRRMLPPQFTLEELIALCNPPHHPPLREIQLTADYLTYAVDEGEAVLLEQGADIYQQHGRIVRAVFDPRSKRPPLILTLSVAAMREELTRAAIWLRFDGRKKKRVAVNCPEDVATTLLSREGKWKLRPLHGLLNAPALRADGSLLNQPGYDAESGLLLMPGGISVTIPDRPTKDDAIAALAVLKDVVKDFPFVTDADRAVWLSGVLTAVMRRTLETAPLHGISATMPGSGKGKLVDMVAMIATGARAESITQGRDTAETEKRIIAAYLRGGLVLSIDNCTTPLDGGDTLSQILTQPTPTIRPLGTSKAVTIEANIALFCNGNNLIIAGENVRRSLRCKLDPGVEHPEQRSFDVEPVSHVRQHRGKYLAAALTILRAHFAAGQPGQPRQPLGSFEEWSRSVRAALLWLGEEDPVGTQMELKADNPDAEVLRVLLQTWYGVYQSSAVLVKDVIAASFAASSADAKGCELRDAIVEATKGKPDTLAYFLRGKAGQIHSGLLFRKDGVVRKGAGLWQVVEAPKA